MVSPLIHFIYGVEERGSIQKVCRYNDQIMQSTINPSGMDVVEGISGLSLSSAMPDDPDHDAPVSNPKHDDSVSKRKKKKKKKPSACAAALVLPSQKLVESAFPWKTMIKQKRGRCAVSTRNIKAGEIIVAERAVAFLPRLQYRSLVCHACCKDLAEGTTKMECSSCGYTVYCQECAKDSVSLHQQWCHVIKEVDGIAKETNCDADLLRFIFNLALKHPINSKEGNKEEQGNGYLEGGVIFSSFQDAMVLQCHRDRASNSWRDAVRLGCKKLHDIIAQVGPGDLSTLFSASVENLEHLGAIINTNAHGMGAQGLHNTDVALGIFPYVSMLNHSCRPNCCFASEGSTMYVRATYDIPQDTELCVSYINLYEPRGTRKRQLAATKYFDCSCERCLEPFSQSVDRFLEGCVCNVKGCGGVIVRSSSLHNNFAEGEESLSWECDSCKNLSDLSKRGRDLAIMPWEIVSEAEQQLVRAVTVYGERHFKDARTLLENYIVNFTGKLHPLHVLLFDAFTPLMNCCRALGDAEEGIRVCRRILNCMEQVLLGPSLEIANFYFCLGEMYSERAESSGASTVLVKRYRKQAQDAFKRVQSIRKICMGDASLPA